MNSARKLKHMLCAAAFLLTGGAAHAELSAEIPTMLPGETTEASVNVSNPAETTAMQFTITLPEGFTIPDGKLTLTERASGHSTEVNAKGDSQYKCVIYSASNTPIDGTSGALFSFRLQAPASAKSGDYTVLFSGIRFSGPDGKETSEPDVKASVRIFIPVESISLSSTEVEITKGSSATLTATVLPENATDRSLNWTSDNTGVATVDASGNITANGIGIATITATAADGSGVSASCIINVGLPSAESVSVEPAELTLYTGETTTLKATVAPEEASQEVEWISDDPETARVTQDGLVTALREGMTPIWARCKDNPEISACCMVTVTEDNAVEINTADNLNIKIERNEITISGKDAESVVQITDMEGRIICRTKESVVRGIDHGVYIITIDNHQIKIRI
ncbi:MAG: Ig-like domain-containing protein [Muribaculaceae bacterium]|nr:Ig-like domain-containing protein [Muribaculaceae bacterium]